jgi:hypothetical protein
MKLKSVDIVGINTLFVGGKMLNSTIRSSDRGVKSLSYDSGLGMVVLQYEDDSMRMIPREVVIMEPDVNFAAVVVAKLGDVEPLATEVMAEADREAGAVTAKAAARKRS